MAGSPCPFFLQTLSSGSIPPADVNVIDVTADGSANIVWSFDQDISALPATGDKLEVEVDGLFEDGGTATAEGDNALVCGYSEALIGADPWRILSHPPGLVFANGHTLAIPQSGLTTGP